MGLAQRLCIEHGQAGQRRLHSVPMLGATLSILKRSCKTAVTDNTAKKAHWSSGVSWAARFLKTVAMDGWLRSLKRFMRADDSAHAGCGAGGSTSFSSAQPLLDRLGGVRR